MGNETVEVGSLKSGDRFMLGGVVNVVVDAGACAVYVEAEGCLDTLRVMRAATAVTPLPLPKQEPERDLSLLRQIDASKLQLGDRLLHFQGERDVTYLNGPDGSGYIAVEDANGRLRIRYAERYRMTPLAWVDGRPVYRGDSLYHEGKLVQALEHVDNVGWMTCADGCHRNTEAMTWEKPKVKREAWINVYGESRFPRQHRTKERADELAGSKRVACLHVEWEE